MTVVYIMPDAEAAYRWDMIGPVTRANALYLGYSSGRISFHGILRSGFYLVENIQPGYRPSWFNEVMADMMWAAAGIRNDELYELLSKLDEMTVRS